jgi:uroporphyrin-III C-methyltransferase / precorrin-2 dehydrogenase / sirohydrochlorin ferrochelatase
MRSAESSSRSDALTRAGAVEYLPLFVDLHDRPVVVVGGGSVALRKIELLRSAGARVSVVSPLVAPGVRALGARGEITISHTSFDPVQLAGAALVIAATDDCKVNAAVASAARDRGLWVNVVDSPAESTFIVPSIVDRSPIVVAVSSGGASPMLARRVRARIEALLPAGLGRLAGLARGWREPLKRQLTRKSERRRFWDWFFDSRPAQSALDAGGQVHTLDFETTLKAFQSARQPQGGMVYLVGAGPGDPDLITLKALEALGRADVILHDRLVSPEILARGRRDAERIYVGKQGYGPQVSQEDTTALLVGLARAGKTVVRLKGGDPFVFGRGGEEVLALVQQGVPVQVIPGITAALGCAAAAQIPLTHRSAARAVTFATAQNWSAAQIGQIGDRAQIDGGNMADALVAGRDDQTWVIYMGGRQLAAVSAQFLQSGLAADTPAAVIADGTRPTQQVVFATLATIAGQAACLPPDAPSLLIVGQAVGVGARIALTTQLQSAGNRSTPTAATSAAA